MGRLLHGTGAFAAKRPWPFVVAWLLIAVGLVLFVHRYGSNTSDNLRLPGTGSQAATDLLASSFPPQQNGTSPIVFHSASGTVTDVANKSAIEASRTAILKVPHVYSATDPFSQKGQAQVSKDGKTAFIPVLLDVSAADLDQSLAEDILDAANPGIRAGMEVAAGGPVGSELSEPDAGESEVIGLVAAMLILTVALGSVVAMGMPIASAVVGLAVGLSGIVVLGYLVTVPSIAPTLATMIGLGVGIDYALFVVNRHRDNLHARMRIEESIPHTIATAGSAVVYAGGTVVIALLALGLARIPLVTSLGYAAAVAVATAVLATITLLPALLSLVGRRIDALKPPLPRRRTPGSTGLWTRWAGLVARHPGRVVLVTLVLLAPLLIPVRSLTLGQKDVGAEPKSTTARQAYDLIANGFGVGYNGPLLIAVELGTPATPSEEYESQVSQAQSLQTQLEQEQKQGMAQADQLTAESKALQQQQAELEQQQSELLAQQKALTQQSTQLSAEESALEAQGKDLQREAAQLKKAIASGSLGPKAVAAAVSQLAQQAASLATQAATLAREAASLTRQGQELAQQASALQLQAANLQTQAAELQTQQAELLGQQQQAKTQQAQAEQLKSDITAELTKAGGDDRGTDPRLVTLQDALVATTGVKLVSPPQINEAGDATVYSVIATTAPSSPVTADLVRTLRTYTIPQATNGTDLQAFVGGSTAANVDLAAAITAKLRLVIFVVVLLSFLVLMAAYRSLVIPAQAAVANVLAVTAAFGILTAAFQWGWALSLVGIDTASGTDPIASFVPLMMFAVLFGLSMDYQVFLLSQVEHHWKEGLEPAEAVAAGLAGSARVIVSAALVMMAVFGSFILNGDPTVKQFGVGLSVGVALAATMVLSFAPAVLTIAGRASWWLPARLDRVLPRVDLEGSGEPVPVGTVAEPDAP